MTAGLEEAEAFEQSSQHVVDLLNQVDQKLKESKAVLERLYAGAPPAAQTKVQNMKDAIGAVETVLTQMVLQHNTVVADIETMKDDLKQHAAAAEAAGSGS
jgi:hypothetical protein